MRVPKSVKKNRERLLSDMRDLAKELKEGAGYGTLRGAIPETTCATCRSELLKRARQLDFDVWPGVRSKRIKDPLEWGGPAFAELLNATATAVGSAMEDVLGPSPWLTSFHALALYPEPDRTDAEVRKLRMTGLHSDFPYGEFKEKMDRAILTKEETGVEGRPMGHGDRGWQFPPGFRPGEPGGPHTVQTIWILDKFTPERGATALLPGSCRWKRVPNCGPGPDWDRFEKEAVPQRGRCGDILFYVGATWHTIGVNRGSSPRVAILGQWSPHFMCPLEAHVWTTPSRTRRRLSSRARALMGFPGSVQGYGETSRPPHRDGAPRFLRDSARFALDHPVLRSRRLLLLFVILSLFAVSPSLPSTATLALFLVGGSVGYVLGTHATLTRMCV